MSLYEVLSYKGAALDVAQDSSGVQVLFLQDSAEDHLQFKFRPSFNVTKDTYVLFPACCYKGNQFKAIKRQYPPMFMDGEYSVDMPVTMTDVPRLEEDGSGYIDITTGDVAVPCLALYDAASEKAWLFYTVQGIDGNNFGLRFGGGELCVTYPHMRNTAYRWPFLVDAADEPMNFKAGDTVKLPWKVLERSCASMEEFYRIYFENRKCMGMDAKRYVPELSYAQQVKIHTDKYNALNWSEGPGFYGSDVIGCGGYIWQPGWVGGGMSSYALMCFGGPLEWERGIRTLEFLFHSQMPCGFFWELADDDGNRVKKVHDNYPHAADWHLIRKSSDALLFIFKTFRLMQKRGVEIPAHMVEGARRCADAFVTMWEKYGQFGQFIALENAEIKVGGSTCAAMAGAALAEAYDFFKNERYLEVAEAATLMLYERDAVKGFTTGGPGEILQCPDSESAFAMLESAVALYEKTGKQEWLDRAVYLVHYCSSWVVAYNYRFPEWSEFGEKDMKTTGSVWANAQNKHSAPGPCTVSADSLYKVWQWTKDPLYLELFLDVTTTISQYMSREDRPIRSWDVPKDATLLQDDSIRAERDTLPSGYICERVNMSDWESKRCVGGVFNGSTWAEVTNMLVLAECSDFPEVKAILRKSE